MDNKQKPQKTVNDLLLELAEAADTMTAVKKAMTKEYLANLKALREEAEVGQSNQSTGVTEVPTMS